MSLSEEDNESLDDIREKQASDPKDTSDRERERDLPAYRLSHGKRTDSSKLRFVRHTTGMISRSIDPRRKREIKKYRDLDVELEEEINLR